MSSVISFRIDKELKKKMEELKHINWSQVIRESIIQTIKKEEEKRAAKNYDRIKKAAAKTELLSRKIEGWNSVEEIRKWRERRQ